MLELLAKHHKDWLRFTKCFIGYYAEDIVQEMYLKFSEVEPDRYIVEGVLQKNYIFATLRNLCIDYHRVKDRIVKVEFIEELENDFKTNDVDDEYLEEHHRQHLEIREALNKEDRFLEMYYMIYTDASNPSYRDIADATNIGLMSIFHDMKRVKKIIKNTKK